MVPGTQEASKEPGNQEARGKGTWKPVRGQGARELVRFREPVRHEASDGPGSQ